MHTSDFDYSLPPELIAQHPVPRGESRLLIVRPGGEPALEDAVFRRLPLLIPPGDVLVVNTTRVRHARFLGTRPSGAPAEILLVHPAPGGAWLALGKPGSALRPGKRISIGPDAWIETVEILPDGNRMVRFGGLPAEEAIARHGLLPLPPYIDRPATEADDSAYQTVYAERVGSVAAPTAGLHFTPEIMRELEGRGVGIARLELEVGPGTFKPVETENIAQHPMHPERFVIPEPTARQIEVVRERGGHVWAVGTTVVRALESAGRDDGTVEAGAAETRLLIAPGFRFRVVDRLLTNFHLPRSTLLMLVSAFAGYEVIMAAYRHAAGQRYRFYSYGDAMVILDRGASHREA